MAGGRGVIVPQTRTQTVYDRETKTAMHDKLRNTLTARSEVTVKREGVNKPEKCPPTRVQALKPES